MEAAADVENLAHADADRKPLACLLQFKAVPLAMDVAALQVDVQVDAVAVAASLGTLIAAASVTTGTFLVDSVVMVMVAVNPLALAERAANWADAVQPAATR